MNWSHIARVEPRLQNLLYEIKAVKDDKSKPSFCANAVWYGDGFRKRCIRLVGWKSDKPILRTQQAYDLVYDKLYSALPDCRNCACL
jgi:hypothetical protein